MTGVDDQESKHNAWKLVVPIKTHLSLILLSSSEWDFLHIKKLWNLWFICYICSWPRSNHHVVIPFFTWCQDCSKNSFQQIQAEPWATAENITFQCQQHHQQQQHHQRLPHHQSQCHQLINIMHECQQQHPFTQKVFSGGRASFHLLEVFEYLMVTHLENLIIWTISLLRVGSHLKPKWQVWLKWKNPLDAPRKGAIIFNSEWLLDVLSPGICCLDDACPWPLLKLKWESGTSETLMLDWR